MAAFADHALKVFGTPERELRRRWLHPFGLAPAVDEPDTDLVVQEEEVSTRMGFAHPCSSSRVDVLYSDSVVVGKLINLVDLTELTGPSSFCPPS